MSDLTDAGAIAWHCGNACPVETKEQFPQARWNAPERKPQTVAWLSVSPAIPASLSEGTNGFATVTILAVELALRERTVASASPPFVAMRVDAPDDPAIQPGEELADVGLTEVEVLQLCKR